jgi:16S rRNA (uracil1498-N3)-methyltransferase
MDDVMRMTCELGVDRLQTLQGQRCVPQAEHRPERWQSILREAMEQCERLWAPELTGVCAAADWWETPDQSDLRLLAVPRETAVPHLADLLATRTSVHSSIWLAIGPEGGWTDQELAAAAAAGWVPVSLGDTILRSSTAAVAGVTTLSSWRRLRS